jgi:predicted NBD/HSP70 family sugar kinase
VHKFNKAKGLLEAYVGGGSIGDFYKVDLSTVVDSDKLWEEVTDYLAVGINNISCLLKPQLVVIGGGIGLKRKVALDSVIEKVKKYNEFVESPEVKFTDVQGNSSLIGALGVNFVDNLELNT